MVKAFNKREIAREKEHWRRIRWAVAHIINISMKSVKHPVRPDHLLPFVDEIKVYSPEERRKRTQAILKHHKKKFWYLLKTDEKGKVKVFGEEEYRTLHGKARDN